MNIKKIWIMLIIALVSICTVSCGGDDDDDNNSPNSTTVVPDPEGTLEIFLNTGATDKPCGVCTVANPKQLLNGT